MFFREISDLVAFARKSAKPRITLRARLIIQKSLHRLHFRKASAPVQRLVYTQCTLSIPNQRQELLCAAIQHGGKMASL